MSVDQRHSEDLGREQAHLEVATAPAGRTRPKLLLALVLLFAFGLGTGWIVNSAIGDGSEAVDANRATVEKWIEAVQNEDVGDIARLYSEDATWYDEAGKDEFNSRGGVTMGWAIFGLVDEVVLVEPVAVTDDAAVVRWQFRGAGWDVTGLSALTMTDGVITAETVYYHGPDGP